MSEDRIRGALFPPSEDLPEPWNAIVYVEPASGGFKLLVCASCAQVRAALADCGGTEDSVRSKLFVGMDESCLPEASDQPVVTVEGWAAAYLVDALDGDQLLREDDVDRFTETVESTYHLISPETDEEGDRAILCAMDQHLTFVVLVLPSRASVRETLETFKELVDGQVHEDSLEQFEQRTSLPETSEEPIVLIEGYAACFITTVLHCLDERRKDMS